MIAEICLVIGSSNSTAERGYSKLTTLHTGKRLSMSHSSIESCLLIAANAGTFSNEEKDYIIKTAATNYLIKRKFKPSFVKKNKILMMTEELSGNETDNEEVEAAAMTAGNVPITHSDQGSEVISMDENSDIDSSFLRVLILLRVALFILKLLIVKT